MLIETPELLDQVRDKFAHVDACPFSGPRVFFENAGGALTLKSAVETSAKFAAIPDNQGRDNPASHALVDIIEKSRRDMGRFFGTSRGHFFVGESGTELLFRLVRTAIASSETGAVLGSSIEHPASRSACLHWADALKRPYINVPHSDATGTVSADAYAECVTPETRVATILHTSPVTGMSNDVGEIATAIRNVAPECFIIVDGIQHASHGGISIDTYGIDGYVVSPYKVFSRHGYGVAWVSDRLRALDNERLVDGPDGNWEFGTRDTGSYATFSDVVAYFEWLGQRVSSETDSRKQIEAAGRAIQAHEKALTDAMLHGFGNLKGLSDFDGVTIIGGTDNPAREGLVCFALESHAAAEIVTFLNKAGVRTHLRKPDHYSGNILKPLGLEGCVRVSLCHYNSLDDVAAFLSAMAEMTA